MIASNYRKFPEAMALQLVLIFGKCRWHTARPTTRTTRKIRADRGQLVKKTPQLVTWLKTVTPQWWRDAKRKAATMANEVRAAILAIDWAQDEQPKDEAPQFQFIKVHDQKGRNTTDGFRFGEGKFTAYEWTYKYFLDEEELDQVIGRGWAPKCTRWCHPAFKGHAHYLDGYH